MKASIAIFAEADRKIGTGHLVESLDLARLALKESISVSLWVRSGAPESILSKAPCAYRLFDSLSSSDAPDIRAQLKENGCRCAILNFRKVSNNEVLRLKTEDLKIICIDELGGLHLDCDAVINSSIVEKYHSYTSSVKDFEVFKGPAYLAMSEEYRKAHTRNRAFTGEIKVVTVTMGGVDRTGATIRLIDILSSWRKEAVKNIVLGAGFLRAKEARLRIEAHMDKNFRIFQDLPGLEPLVSASDVVFTAGGNTLYELACVGTPPIVLYEDNHEMENGIAFEKLGFGFCPGRSADVNETTVMNALNVFDDPRLRQAHADAGKRLVDGRGARRILDVVRRIGQGLS